ncbi:MAG: trypsin-like peptidase domain-containing protein [Oscillospiraceae bacterium]|nr:trypsin-like peptidase domain-containing protein [Oscillospiraceae bacterium]
MDEEFSKDTENVLEEITGDDIAIENEDATVGEQPVTESEPVYTPPVTNPSQPYTPPAYGNGQYVKSSQYMPYGIYQNVQAPAEKKPSQGKKKGLIIAIVIICAAFLAATVSIAAMFAVRAFKDETPRNEAPQDNTQMELVGGSASGDELSADGKLSAKGVYQKIYESSVGILVYTRNQQQLSGEGTGVVMGLNGDSTATYIITCAHVIEGSNISIVVQTHDGTQYDATIVGVDTKTDIGLLRISATNLKAAEFADSGFLEVGDTVYAIGNPGGTQFFGSFTNGMVSAIARPVNSPVGYQVACIQHTAAINPGNSGGALVDENGRVVGINSSKIASTDYEGMGFAVPSATVKEIVDMLIRDGHVINRPVLGINFMQVAESQVYSIIVKTNNLPAGSIIIADIKNGSDLLNKDVREGDLIIAVNGTPLETFGTLLEAIEKGKVGDTLTLTICRIDTNYQTSTFDISVKLVEDASVSEVEETETDPYFPFPFDNIA